MSDVKGINFNSLSLEQLNRADVTDNEKKQIICIFNDVDNKEGDSDERKGFISGNALIAFYSKLSSAFGEFKIVDLILKIRDTYATDDSEKAKKEKIAAREKEINTFVANLKVTSEENKQSEANRILTEYGDTFNFKNREQVIDYAVLALKSKDSDFLLKALEAIMPFTSANSKDNMDELTETLNTIVPDNPYQGNNRVSQQDVINLRSAIIKQLYDNETNAQQ